MSTVTEIPKGIESLKAAVLKDCGEGDNCFSESGCTKQRYKMMPEENPRLVEMGFTDRCVKVSKCDHDYCGKFKWVMDRAAQYAEITGKTVEKVVAAWDAQRTYWDMCFYQHCNQPEIKADANVQVILFDDWVKEMQDKYGDDKKTWAFKC